MSKDPLDEALSAKEKLAAKRKAAVAKRNADDAAMIEAWKADPTPANMRPIMQRFMPLVKRQAIQGRAPLVNPQAFEAKGQNLLIGAIQSYDPSKGTAPESWVTTKLQPLQRYNLQEANMARIPEAPALRIGSVNTAREELLDELGREPTHQEIAEAANPRLSKRQQLTGQRVQKIMESQRGDIIGSTFESDPTPHAISRERQIIGQLRPTLQPDQQEIYDYLYGEGGKPKVTSTSQLAKLLKKSPSQISRLRSAILAKYKEYA